MASDSASNASAAPASPASLPPLPPPSLLSAAAATTAAASLVELGLAAARCDERRERKVLPVIHQPRIARKANTPAASACSHPGGVSRTPATRTGSCRRALDRDVDELAERGPIRRRQDHGLEPVGAAHQLFGGSRFDGCSTSTRSRRPTCAANTSAEILSCSATISASRRFLTVGGDVVGQLARGERQSRSEYANMNALSNRISRISASVCAVIVLGLAARSR